MSPRIRTIKRSGIEWIEYLPLEKMKGTSTTTMRKIYDKEFKAKAAIAALTGEKTIQEIAIANGVHRNIVTS